MKRIGVCFLFIIVLCGASLKAYSETGNGLPLKYIDSCELDFNNDDLSDIALLVETIKGRELIVLMRTKSGYNAFMVSNEISDMYLSCHFGKTIEETTAGKGKRNEGKIHKTPGTYIKLTMPESSSVAYYWDKNKFKEVWLSD